MLRSSQRQIQQAWSAAREQRQQQQQSPGPNRLEPESVASEDLYGAFLPRQMAGPSSIPLLPVGSDLRHMRETGSRRNRCTFNMICKYSGWNR